MAPSERFRRIFRVLVTALCLLGVLALTVVGVLWMRSLSSDADKLGAFQERIASLGIVGWLVLFVIQYIQIVIAFIPGGPIQVVAGALYGPGGILICLAGTIAASLSVFAIVKRFGKRALHLFVDEADTAKYKFLSDARRLEHLVLLLFFIPGTPKDALTYLFALTPIDMGRFLVLATCARMPALITSVLAGDRIAEGLWLQAGVMFLIISLISLGGFFLYRKVISPMVEDRRRKTD